MPPKRRARSSDPSSSISRAEKPLRSLPLPQQNLQNFRCIADEDRTEGAEDLLVGGLLPS